MDLLDLGVREFFRIYLTKLRKMLIVWLAGKKLPVLLNSRVYDDVIEYNRKKAGDILTYNCRIEKIEKHIQREAAINKMNENKGVIRQGDAFALDPNSI